MAAAALLLTIASPAGATVTFAWHQRNNSANSIWALNDSYNTVLSVHGFTLTTS
jgi:hypothetical protein